MGLFSGRKKPDPRPRRARPGPSAPTDMTDAAAVTTASEWLAHPQEFGRPPDTASFRCWKQRQAIGFGPKTSHRIGIVDYAYTEPAGKGAKGRVLLGLMTWSFIGPEIEAIPDDELVTAYIGWAFVFGGVHAGTIQHKTLGFGLQLAANPETMAKFGVTQGKVLESYQIGTSQILEFEGTRADGRHVRGAFDPETWLVLDDSQPLHALPAIYTYLGRVASEA